MNKIPPEEAQSYICLEAKFTYGETVKNADGHLIGSVYTQW